MGVFLVALLQEVETTESPYLPTHDYVGNLYCHHYSCRPMGCESRRTVHLHTMLPVQLGSNKAGGWTRKNYIAHSFVITETR